MTSIHETLERLNEKDREKFITMRMTMRRAYLMCIEATIGLRFYNPTDDTFMDAIDVKMEMLAARAGMSTPSAERSEPEISGNDPFAMLTRIPVAIEKPTDKPAPPNNEWKSQQ